MRVAILSANAFTFDAIGRQVAEKLAFFLDRGADVRVFVESDRRLDPAVRPHCRRLDGNAPNEESWEFIRSADLALVEYGQYGPLLQLLPLLAGSRPRIIFCYYGVTPSQLWGSHNRENLEKTAALRGVVWCADRAVTPSRFARRELLGATGFPADGCSLVGLPVPAERLAPGSAPSRLRARLGLADAAVLLFVGRVAPNKRLPILVEALARLRGRIPPVHAIVVGDGGDVYEQEMRFCRERATALGVESRLHFRGQIPDEQLGDVYREADVLVVPSLHEGFCLPVVEGMACGLPVVAARGSALSETVGSAGLSFGPDDADDLARQVGRVLESQRAVPSAAPATAAGAGRPRRVAVVSCRYGEGFVGGAETSLRVMAESLYAAGHAVEVFTTCTRSEGVWTDELPEGTYVSHGIPVHRFRLDAQDPARLRDAARAIAESSDGVSDQVEECYLQNSVASTRLAESLRRRLAEFDAVLTGPMVVGLSAQVAKACGPRTLLVPCCHDEPLARLRLWHKVYGEIGGVLFHSPEEQQFAEAELGLNSPGATCVGTFIDPEVPGHADRGRKRVGGARPYVLYAGRIIAEKGVPAHVEFARRYAEAHPERFTFAFIGRGNVAIPRRPWALDLGFVDEAAKCDLLAGAAALAQLSTRESLSLVALEAWAQGTPVLVSSESEVLTGHLARGAGGRAVADYESFAAALDDLWDHPVKWQAMGRQGRGYVRARYGSRLTFARSLERAVAGLEEPLAERMRRRGLERAERFSRTAWRETFSRIVEAVLDESPRAFREEVRIEARADTFTAAAGSRALLIPVRVENCGTHALAAEGPARVTIHSGVVGPSQTTADADAEAALPSLLTPGQVLPVAVPVRVPDRPGCYEVILTANRPNGPELNGPAARVRLIVQIPGRAESDGVGSSVGAAVQKALTQAHRLRRLPDDYTDVTEGRFARWKAWVKRKLLGNFKNAYVDVLSRQQSAFNLAVLTALGELNDGFQILTRLNARRENVTIPGPSGPETPSGADAGAEGVLRRLIDELSEARGRIHDLEQRLARPDASGTGPPGPKESPSQAEALYD
jgi:glycosyltransferase involved in cell wall biosynthesis